MVKARLTECAAGVILREDAGDQVAGNNEEDVHAGKAAGDDCGKSMEDQYGADGQCSQTIDIRSVCKLCHIDPYQLLRQYTNGYY